MDHGLVPVHAGDNKLAIAIIMMMSMMMPSFLSSNDNHWRVSFGSTIKGVMVRKVTEDVIKATST